MSLTVEQSCHHEGDGWWRWAVWLTGDELADVSSVEYILHPTFPQAHFVVRDRESGFRVERTGWGEFRIYLTVHLRDGSTRDIEHWVRLGGEDPGENQAPVKEMGAEMPDAAPEEPSPEESLKFTPEPARRRVFLTSSLADAALLEAIRERLLDQGFEVGSANDLAAGSPWEEGIQDVLRDTDAAVVLVNPEQASLWTVRDAEAARESKIPVIPVLLGDADARWLPRWMRESKSLRADRSAPDLVAHQISMALRSAR